MQPKSLQPVPYAGYVVAKEKKQSDVVKLGFALPENSRDERNASLGEVVAIGEQIKDYPMPAMKPGQLFAYAPFSSAKLRLGTETWLFIEFKDVLAVFPNE